MISTSWLAKLQPAETPEAAGSREDPEGIQPPLMEINVDTLLSRVERKCPQPFSFDPERKKVYCPRGLPLCGPVAVLGRFRDPSGEAWNRLLGFIDLDGRLQFLLVPNKQVDAGGCGTLIATLADRGLWMSDRTKDIAALDPMIAA